MYERNKLEKEKEEKFRELTKQRARAAKKTMNQQKSEKEKLEDNKLARYKVAMNCKKEKVIEKPFVKQKVAVMDDTEIKPTAVSNKFTNLTKNPTDKKDFTYSPEVHKPIEQNLQNEDSQSNSSEQSEEDDNVLFRNNRNLLQANERYCGIRMMMRNK